MAASASPGSRLQADQVAAYLKEHPDFFLDREDLLADLQLRHPTGGAISLIERQVADLRQRNRDLRRRLGELLGTARDNDQLIEKTRRLTLALLEAVDLGDLVDALYYSLDREFGFEQTRLLLISGRRLSCNTQVVTMAEAQRFLSRRLRLTRVQTGVLEPSEVNFLFGLDAELVGSMTLTVLRPSQPFGVIAIGHADPKHLKANLGIVFLAYLGQLLERLLPNLIAHDPS